LLETATRYKIPDIMDAYEKTYWRTHIMENYPKYEKENVILIIEKWLDC